MSSYPGLFSGGVPTPVVDQAYEAGQREKQGSGITQPGFASGSAAGQPVQLGGSSGQPAGHDQGWNKGTGQPYAGQLQQPPSAAGVGAGGMGGAGIRGGGTGSTGGAVTSHGTGYFNPDRASLGNRLPQIIEAVRQLYSCEPADHIFTQFYAPDSKFEDPLGRLEGIDNVRLAFKGLAEVFEFKGFDRFECVDATSEGLRFEIVCHYRLKPIGPNIPFRCTTIIRLDPASHYIIDHTDDWMGVPLMTPENAGWVGRLAQLRRKVTGVMQAAFVKATGGDKIMAGT